MRAVEHFLHVRKVIHQIGHQDVVEGLGGGKCRHLGDVKLELRMILAGQFDDRRAEINPDAPSRFDCRQQFSGTATQFQNPPSRRNQKAIEPLQQRLIMPGQFPVA